MVVKVLCCAIFVVLVLAFFLFSGVVHEVNEWAGKYEYRLQMEMKNGQIHSAILYSDRMYLYPDDVLLAAAKNTHGKWKGIHFKKYDEWHFIPLSAIQYVEMESRDIWPEQKSSLLFLLKTLLIRDRISTKK